MLFVSALFVFFFTTSSTSPIYTLSLHDALPISRSGPRPPCCPGPPWPWPRPPPRDRKSTRLNSSHANISYAVFCLKKKNKSTPKQIQRALSGIIRSRRPYHAVIHRPHRLS